ncbi:winged helix-turn-helix domain-containing protein [Metabacillus halosaccharovorans]|uniref:winged helix-turn-helix domain-containing protein n=1 Tax=Metabacillus halosaccharovorans TaxID=930124 RepID=UPI001C1FC0E2
MKIVNTWSKIKSFGKSNSYHVVCKENEKRVITGSLITLDDLDITDEIIITVLDLQINYKQRRIYIKNKLLELTPKEFELLLLLALNRRIVFTRKMLTDLIFSIHEHLDIRIVDDQVKTLSKKLRSSHISFNPIRKVWGKGYKFPY